MYYVYILKSCGLDKYYIGHTENITNRLKKHNQGLVRSTKNFIPWKVIYKETFSTRQEAYRREIQIKSYKGGRAFKKLIQNI